MKLIEADKVKQAIKDYWKAQVDKLPIPKSIEEHDVYANRLGTILEYNSDLLKEIEALPSAEPDTTTHDSIPAETGENDGDGTSGDCISRQAALETIRTMQTYKLFAGDDMLLIDQAEAQTELMMLPSAKPVHKTGRWIPTASGKGRHECSRCHEYAPCYQDGSEHLSTFCVLCGAKMERGEEE